ncbi:MAG TPA: hypothetical protein VF142_09795 [Longimicrobium sp.]
MPMIGGELAAEAAPECGGFAPRAYDVGWVADWLYGDAALPPMPLPPREPLPAHTRPAPVHAEAPLHADAPWHADGNVHRRPTPARRARRRGKARQLALL